MAVLPFIGVRDNAFSEVRWLLLWDGQEITIERNP
jgi:hypothetical protein